MIYIFFLMLRTHSMPFKWARECKSFGTVDNEPQVIEAYLWTHIYSKWPISTQQDCIEFYTLLLLWEQRWKFTIACKYESSFKGSFTFLFYSHSESSGGRFPTRQWNKLKCTVTPVNFHKAYPQIKFTAQWLCVDAPFMRHCSAKRCKPGLIATGSAVPTASLPCYLNKAIIKLIIRAAADSEQTRDRIGLLIFILPRSLVATGHQRETNVRSQSDNKRNLHIRLVPLEFNRRALRARLRRHCESISFQHFSGSRRLWRRASVMNGVNFHPN